MNNPITLPRKYLSWSQYSLWKSNKDQYRQRYYEGIKPPESAEILFGKKTAEIYASGALNDVPVYAHTEYKITVTVGGVPLMGYLDSYDTQTHAFTELKTGHAPWDSIRVRAHGQLPFYSLLVERAEGSVENCCHLIWLPTRFKKSIEIFDGHELEADTRELEFTGEQHVFPRKIAKWERQAMEKDILAIARDIAEDYALFLRARKA